MDNDFIEKFARFYETAKVEWLRDKRNAFKDARFVTCFEIREAIASLADEDLITRLRALIRELYETAKNEWLRDRRNTFKDGRFLTLYELMELANA